MVIYLPGQSTKDAVSLDELTPREIVGELDKHVIGLHLPNYHSNYPNYQMGLRSSAVISRSSKVNDLTHSERMDVVLPTRLMGARGTYYLNYCEPL